VNVRGEVHAYLAPEDYARRRLEAPARGVSLSRCAGDCLAEYFALRREMATAFETPDQAGTLTPSRVTHVLLAHTEQRLVATMERYGEDLTAARAEFGSGPGHARPFGVHVPLLHAGSAAGSSRPGLCERPAALRELAQGRGAQPEGVRPVPWPLVDSEAAGGQASSRAGAVSGNREANQPPRPGRAGG
jgi:hypothetical protein